VFWIRTKPQNSKKPERTKKRRKKRKPIRIKLRDGGIGDSTYDVLLLGVTASLFQSKFLNNLFRHYLIFKAKKNYERYGATL
jgi:hypothetical protein